MSYKPNPVTFNITHKPERNPKNILLISLLVEKSLVLGISSWSVPSDRYERKMLIQNVDSKSSVISYQRLL
jgi:hypothetical protein